MLMSIMLLCLCLAGVTFANLVHCVFCSTRRITEAECCLKVLPRHSLGPINEMNYSGRPVWWMFRI